LVAWSAGQRDDGCEGQLSRGARNSSEWLEALRKLGALGATSYRRADANLHDLSRLLGDPWAKPSARAAAAVVLRASGDETAVAKLRIAAEATVEPRVRIALENIADDRAVAEALAMLEEADGEREGRKVV
jgi:HEAT repeat protein